MHALLVKRADALMGCRSPEDEELRALADVIEAYGAKRWPQGKEEKPTKPRQYTTRERVIDDLKTMFWRWRKPLPKE